MSSLKQVYKKLEKIANTPSTNDKVALLKEYLKDQYFKKTVKYALSGDMKFHIKKLPKFEPSLMKGTADQIFEFLKSLSKQTGTSNSDKKKLVQMCSIDKETHEVIRRICNKDLRCGASAKLVNKAKSGTVNTIPYMRCSTSKKLDNIQYPAVVQEKADGMFVHIMVNKKCQVKIITRNGKNVFALKHLKKEIRKAAVKEKILRNIVFDGELLVQKNKKILNRKTGNGILNSCIHNTVNSEDAECIVFRGWDSIKLKNFYNGHDLDHYVSRFSVFQYLVKTIANKNLVDSIISKTVNSYPEAKEFYEWVRKNGGEGAVLKNIFAEWKDHTSTNQVKMKNISEAELVLVGIKKGREDTKWKDHVGSLVFESECGKLKVSVGGLSDDEHLRDIEDWKKEIGTIWTVEFDEVIVDKKTKVHSLFLPRNAEIRVDKNKADTLNEIMKR